ncbi:MAG: hypothetical protein KatS3mg104_2145 [Phycisphaerae bacterium]|jgi:sulfur relay (sulfurtransferase) DsrC/TusE family protein|nr:MAG: hypothetical protein KatS3mg104_2145 [Phycisphaerae bacterium]
MKPIRIGEILMEQGVLNERQVQHILRVQKSVNRPFGDLAERLYGIDARVVEDAWVEQYVRFTGEVDLEEIEVDKTCLRLINRRQAWQFHLAPVFRDQDHLALTTTTEALVRAVNFASRTFNEPVYFMIARKEQLHEFLMKHYPVPDFIAEFAENFLVARSGTRADPRGS